MILKMLNLTKVLTTKQIKRDYYNFDKEIKDYPNIWPGKGTLSEDLIRTQGIPNIKKGGGSFRIVSSLNQENMTEN